MHIGSSRGQTGTELKCGKNYHYRRQNFNLWKQRQRGCRTTTASTLYAHVLALESTASSSRQHCRTTECIVFTVAGNP